MGWILIFFLLLIANMFVGAIVCAGLDTKDRVFFFFFSSDKTGIGAPIVLTFWPIMAYKIIQYKKEASKT